MSKLKNCPFCGSKDVYLHKPLRGGVCKTCAAEGPPSASLDEAIQRWNSRMREENLKRKIVVYYPETREALCDDGTIWGLMISQNNQQVWKKLPEIPQDG